MSNPKNRKSCVVPKCTNTTVNSPDKLFFLVPFDPKHRKKWMQVMKRADPPGNKSNVYCCEDHFNIETDMENYVKYNLVGGRIKLKKGIVPHKFECQKEPAYKPERSAVEKRNRIKYFEKLFNEDPVPATSVSPEEIFIVSNDEDNICEDPLALENYPSLKKSKHNKAVQVQLQNEYKHKGTMTQQKYLKKKEKNIRKEKSHVDKMSVFSYTDTNSITSAYENNPKCSDSEESGCEKVAFNDHMQKTALLCISREPQLLLGIPKKCYFCIDILCQTTGLSARNIMVTLKKIRLHQPNSILALDFGISATYAAVIIRQTIPAIASSMKSLVFFPNPADVSLNLPIPFRKRYAKVQSIIDCFEIQIEKPADPVKQSLTWSEYKGCNTIKYLISITPDGLINFISDGYGGRASDVLIFEDCGFLTSLPKGAAVMADRGFKNIGLLLQKHGYILYRPPSVSAQVKPTRDEVLETKRIAALRIHVERTIGRLRNFSFMLPHACIDLKQIDLLDFIVVSACGLVNMQSGLFKTD